MIVSLALALAGGLPDEWVVEELKPGALLLDLADGRTFTADSGALIQFTPEPVAVLTLPEPPTNPLGAGATLHHVLRTQFQWLPFAEPVDDGVVVGLAALHGDHCWVWFQNAESWAKRPAARCAPEGRYFQEHKRGTHWNPVADERLVRKFDRWMLTDASGALVQEWEEPVVMPQPDGTVWLIRDSVPMKPDGWRWMPITGPEGMTLQSAHGERTLWTGQRESIVQLEDGTQHMLPRVSHRARFTRSGDLWLDGELAMVGNTAPDAPATLSLGFLETLQPLREQHVVIRVRDEANHLVRDQPILLTLTAPAEPLTIASGNRPRQQETLRTTVHTNADGEVRTSMTAGEWTLTLPGDRRSTHGHLDVLEDLDLTVYSMSRETKTTVRVVSTTPREGLWVEGCGASARTDASGEVHCVRPPGAPVEVWIGSQNHEIPWEASTLSADGGLTHPTPTATLELDLTPNSTGETEQVLSTCGEPIETYQRLRSGRYSFGNAQGVIELPDEHTRLRLNHGLQLPNLFADSNGVQTQSIGTVRIQGRADIKEGVLLGSTGIIDVVAGDELQVPPGLWELWSTDNGLGVTPLKVEPCKTTSAKLPKRQAIPWYATVALRGKQDEPLVGQEITWTSQPVALTTPRRQHPEEASTDATGQVRIGPIWGSRTLVDVQGRQHLIWEDEPNLLVRPHQRSSDLSIRIHPLGGVVLGFPVDLKKGAIITRADGHDLSGLTEAEIRAAIRSAKTLETLGN